MFESAQHIVLFRPVIPQNTGAIARLCACTGAQLHLIHPLGFQVDEKSVRRAGLDYWEHVNVKEHSDWEQFIKTENPKSLFLFTKFATQNFFEAKFQNPSYLIFGSETKGLPQELREQFSSSCFKIPMRTHLVRSLNLAQSVAIVTYEALRQTNWP